MRMHSYKHTHVLRTNLKTQNSGTKLSAQVVALTYPMDPVDKNLWLVKNTFRNIKDILPDEQRSRLGVSVFPIKSQTSMINLTR